MSGGFKPQYSSVKLKTICQNQFFNIDAKPLAAGFRQRAASR
jgi:hypothetical protein